jgi:hypothetical protein
VKIKLLNDQAVAAQVICRTHRAGSSDYCWSNEASTLHAAMVLSSTPVSMHILTFDGSY